jgi:hypothetical protein
MRKFITLGVGAVATATMAFAAAAGPATAAISPPGSMVGQVCATLPTQATAAVTGVANAVLAQTAALSDLNAKTPVFQTAQADLVTALVDYIKTVDAGGSVGAKLLTLNDKVAIYSEKATAWGNSSSAVDAANRNLQIAQMSSTTFAALLAGLANCV